MIAGPCLWHGRLTISAICHHAKGMALQYEEKFIVRHPLNKGIGLFTLSVEIAGGDGLVHPFETGRIHAAQILDY